MICEKAAVFFVSSAQVQERHAKPHAGRRVETRTFSPRFATRCPFLAVSDALEPLLYLLSYYSPPTVPKDALAQNNNANAARSTPTIRVGTAPHSPRKAQKPVDAAASTGFFVE